MNGNDAAPRGGCAPKGCVLGGCGCAVGALAVFLIFGAVMLVLGDREMKKVSAIVAADLQRQGFAPLDGEDLSGIGMWKLCLDLASRDCEVETPPAGRIYALGKTLRLAAPCAHDVVFFGTECEVLQPLDGNLVFLAIGPGTVRIAPGASVRRVCVGGDAQVVNNGAIVEGIFHDPAAGYDMAELQKALAAEGVTLRFGEGAGGAPAGAAPSGAEAGPGGPALAPIDGASPPVPVPDASSPAPPAKIVAP